MINREAGLPIGRQAELLAISRGAFYYTPQPENQEQLALYQSIDKLHTEHPHMGTRMLQDSLLRAGIHAGRDRLRTAMRVMGLQAIAPQPGTSKPAIGHKIYPYLLRHMHIDRPNQVWAMDTTYIAMRHGFVYLTAVEDLYSRKILAHKTATTLEAIHAYEVLHEAAQKYGAPEIVNTDQGSQFTAEVFIEEIKRMGAKISMDGKGAWRDNVFVERVWRSVKYECVYLKAYDTVPQARADIDRYFKWYNSQRPHKAHREANRAPTPDEVYFGEQKQLMTAA